MTYEEFEKIPMQFVAHMSMDDEHTVTYASPNGRLSVCTHTPVLKYGNFGKPYKHYRIDKKVYKSKKKFVEALENYHENQIPLKIGMQLVR